MKTSYLLALMLPLLCCANPKVTRHGYDYARSNPETDCEIAIMKEANFSQEDVEVLGKIDIGDSGFSVKCNERDVLEILKREGCQLEADIVNITEEKRPDLLSTCYRASAEFLRIREIPKPVSDAAYAKEEITKRLEADDRRKFWWMTGSVIAGVILGLFVF